MTPRRYELTNEQWEQIKAFFSPYSTGRPPKRSNCETTNSILWISRSSAPWRDLPDHYGLLKTVYARFCKWSNKGVLLTIFQELNAKPDSENLSIVLVQKSHKS